MINPKKLGKTSVALGLSILMLGTNVANAESYKLEKPINVYSTAYDAKMKKNPVTTYSAGTYNIFRRFDGQINITKNSNPGGWINPDEVKDSTNVQKAGNAKTTPRVTQQSQKPAPQKTESTSTKAAAKKVEVKKTYKSTAVVNIRTGAGTNYRVLGTVPYGSEISGVMVGNWIKITYNGQTAYTIADYYKEVTNNQTSNNQTSSKPSTNNNQTYKNYYATSDVYVRSGKGSNYAKVGINYLGSKVYGVIEGPWLKFTYNGKTAYTAAAYYTEKSPSNNKPSQGQNPTIANAKEFVSNTAVYFRSGKGSNYSKLGINYEGDVIKGVVEGDWIKFVYNNQFAYTAAAYYTQKGVNKPQETEKDPFKNVKLTKYKAESSVYARSAKSSANNTKVGVVSKGEIIDGVIDGAWIKFKYNGSVAYTAKAYYKDLSAKPAPKPSTPAPSKPSAPLNRKELSYMAEYGVNVRSDASESSEKVGFIPKGSTIRGVKEGDWIRFTYNSRQCYTAAQYFTPLSIPETSSSNVSSQQAFINRIAPTAKVLAKGNDLYASVMIAQCILETGYGTSWLSSSNINNLFGIKGHYNGQYVVLNAFEYEGSTRYYEVAHFKKYPSIAESMMDYVSLLTANNDTTSWRYNYYKGVRRSQTSSYRDATRALTGTYATAPNYYSSLNQLIEQYNLTQYD